MRLPASLAALTLLLAGCSGAGDSGGASPDGATPDASASGTGTGAPTVPAPAPVEVPLDWDGTLVAGAWACESTVTQQCHWQPEGAFGQSHAFEGLVGNVTGGGLRLEWTTETPLTTELVLEAVVATPDCDDCNHTMLGSVHGPSPLSIPLADDLRFTAGEVLFVAVYSYQYMAVDQGAAGTSGDQDFTVSGNVTLVS